MTTPKRGAESAEEVLKRIHATLVSAAGRQTTPSPAGRKPTETKRNWLSKWLKVNAYNQKLRDLEEAVYDFCSGYAKNPGTGYRLLIHGNNGTGKSHAAKAINRWARSVAIHLPLMNGEEGMRLSTSEFYNWPSVVDRLKSGEWDLIEHMMEPDLLVIDDLGAEHDPSRVGMEKLYLLLERRESRWTVITTNVAPEAWELNFERRISSRFLRNFKHVSLEDVRDFKTMQGTAG